MTAKEDLFTPIHKGLRSLLYATSARIQTNDFGDVDATRTLVHDLDRDFATARVSTCALCIMAAHAEAEETMIFPESEKFGNELVARLVREHRELARQELAIAEAGRRLLALGTPSDRIAAGVALNQTANELLAAYFGHMNLEETDLVPLMREHFTDAQMAAMRGRIISGLPPDQLFAFLGWILPSMNVTELSEMIGVARAAMPPPVFAKVTGLCAARVDPARWTEVRARTGI